MKDKKLYRSREDKMFGGICGGLGEYFGIDSTLIRLIGAVLALVTGIAPAVMVYIIAVIIIPVKPEDE